MQAFDYVFNEDGSYTASLQGMAQVMGAFTAEIEYRLTDLGHSLFPIILDLKLVHRPTWTL